MWKEIFAEKFLDDDRTPVLTFEFPGVEGKFGLLAPQWHMWQQLVLLAILSQIVQILCAILVYKWIIPRRGSIEAYMMGWGLVIPFVLWLPYEIVEYYDLQNLAVKTIPSMIPIAVVFRTIEAMYQTSPPFVEESLWSYATYYTTGVPHIWDHKLQEQVKPTREQLWTTVWRVIYFYHVLSLSLSYMLHHNFAPFHNSPVVRQDFHLNADMLHPAHLANGYCLAAHTYFHLRFFFECLKLAENAKGYLTKEPFRDPLWSSTSPTDFWGRRWNLIIHQILKRGAFLPARKLFPKQPIIAKLIAFVSSGLLHDYCWSVTFYHHSHKIDQETGICADCYGVKALKLTSFFLWNGVVMILERPLGKFPPFAWLTPKNGVPVFVISTLVLSTALPVSHWFTGDWVVGGVYQDWSLAFWFIKKLEID